MNLYASPAHAFRPDQRQAVVLLGEQAGVVLANTRAFAETRERVRQLQEALDSRIVIEQAKGVLMERNRCDGETAFTMLKDQSQRKNQKLRLIAEAIVESVTAR